MNKRFIKKKVRRYKIIQQKDNIENNNNNYFYTKCIHCLHNFFIYLYGCFCRKIFFKLSGLVKLSIKIDVSKS